MYKNLSVKILKPMALGLFLTNIKNVSKASKNEYPDSRVYKNIGGVKILAFMVIWRQKK